jgi:type IV pilus assembly protein PilW
VSITIGLFVLAGVMQLYLTSAQNVSSFEGSSRIQENARYVFSRFEMDIGQAGNMGCFSSAFLHEPELRVHNILGEDSASGGLYDFSSFINGENDIGPGRGGADSSDRLIVRYANTGKRYPVLDIDLEGRAMTLPTNVTESIEVGQVLIIGDCSASTVFSVSDVDTSTGVIRNEGGAANADGDQYNINGGELGPEYLAANANDLEPGNQTAYVYTGQSGAFSYEIDTSTAGNQAGETCNATTPQYCALLRGGVEIVEGVEDLQFEYGWISSDSLIFVDADAIEAKANTDEIWKLIDRIRVTATFNSINSAVTNEGVDLLTRTYSQVFVVHNQLPASLE